MWQPSAPGRQYIYGRAPRAAYVQSAGARRAAVARAPVHVLKRVDRARGPEPEHDDADRCGYTQALNHRPGVGSWAELN